MAQAYSRLGLYIGLLRPKTLFSGLSPVLVALAYAFYQGYSDWSLSALLVLIAVSAQIASNIVNDLIDYRKGADTDERKGPLRPLSKGLVSEREVKVALALSLLVLVLSGVAVMAQTTWWLALVGVAVVCGLWAYSGGPYPLSYRGWGEVAVLVFFGWIPTIVSYYVLTGILYEPTLYLLATSIGLASVNILVVNNYRDVEEDRQVGKRTLIVRLGQDFAPRLYLSCAMLSVLLLYPLYSALGIWCMLCYAALAISAYKSLITSRGEALNKTLALTARNVFFLSLLVIALLTIKSFG